MSTVATSLSIQFDNRALRDLPLDAELDAGTRAVRGACFSRVEPTPIAEPVLVSKSINALRDCVRLTPTEIADDAALAQVFSGNVVLPGSEPAAHCYAGFQFGHFAGQLGDGRAMYLGQVRDADELQLKGAGMTPYSRSADGRAVLRSSVREFLASEAMHALGVPTTRAGTLVTSRRDTVQRDRNYDGNVIDEPVAVVLRLAPSFLRFGSFQICVQSGDREGPSLGLDDAVLPPLLRHLVRCHFPEIEERRVDERQRWLAWFAELVERTARTAAHWQTVGFCHGVLNTDNLSAIGVTIDYGPFGFMERFHRGYVCNTSDNEARYSYEAQPAICEWNCVKLAEALQRVLPLDETQRIVSDRYHVAFERHYRLLMRRKLGLDERAPAAEQLEAADDELFVALFDVMERTASDFTNTFRALSQLDLAAGDDAAAASADALLARLVAASATPAERAAPHRPAVSDEHLRHYVALAQRNPMLLYMAGKSPQWLMDQMKKHERYRELLATPADIAADREAWRVWLERYRARLRRDTPAPTVDSETARRAGMDAVNPKFVLRNWVAERAIRAAEDRSDFSVVNRLLGILEQPFVAHQAIDEEFCYAADINELASLCVSCSS